MGELPEDVARRLKKISKGVLPPGGRGGRVLRKASNADYDVAWQPDSGIPAGGTVGQVLTKTGYSDGNYDWRTPPTLPAGGTTGQVLTKIDATDFNADWETPPSGGSGFPVGPEDDGVGTTVIIAEEVGGTLSHSTWSNTNNADGSVASVALFSAVHDAGLTENTHADSGADISVVASALGTANTGLWQVSVNNNAGSFSAAVDVAADATGSRVTCAGTVVECVAAGTGGLNLNGLPTSDPGVSGQLWNDSGTVKVSP